MALEAGQKAILDKLAEIGKSIDASRLDNEKRFSAIDIKLNAVDAKVENKASSETLTRIAGEIGARIVSIEGKIDAKSAATDVATLKGAVEKLPTTIQLAGFILAVFVAAGVAKHFGW